MTDAEVEIAKRETWERVLLRADSLASDVKTAEKRTTGGCRT